MSSEEEELRPAFADAGWSGPAGKAVAQDDEYEYFEEVSGSLSLSLVREGDTIVGRVLNTGETVVLDSRPVVSFSFSPAELLKFDMPSVLIPRKEEQSVTLAGKASTQILLGTWKSSRWVFQWASEDATRTHQSSYTLHPKVKMMRSAILFLIFFNFFSLPTEMQGCEITIRVELFPGKPSLEAKIKI